MNGSLSLSSLLSMAVALLAGAAVPFQGGSNAALGRMLGHPLWATLASLLVSIVVVLPLLFVAGAGAHGRRGGPGAGMAVAGGVAGVAYLTAALVLTPAGRASFIVSVMAGQMLASLVIDHFGLMGLAPKPIALGRLVGVGLILVGAGIVQAHSVAPRRRRPVRCPPGSLENGCA